MARLNQTRCFASSWLDNVKFLDHPKCRPEARVSIRGLLCIRNNRQRCHNGLKIFSTPGLVRFCPTLYSVPQLRHSDGCDFKAIIWSRCCPGGEVKDAPFPANDDVDVENDQHLSAGSLAALRAFRRSRRQALASSGDNSGSASSLARSRPKQTFSLSGTKRAKGAPFLRRTKVTF